MAPAAAAPAKGATAAPGGVAGAAGVAGADLHAKIDEGYTKARAIAEQKIKAMIPDVGEGTYTKARAIAEQKIKAMIPDVGEGKQFKKLYYTVMFMFILY